MNKVLVICGATATGKTRLAVDCAKKLNTEIISADSQLVYRGLDIGTAKPTEKEMCGIKHHMIDVVDADSEFSVADYKERAKPVIDDLLSRGKTPIICGGTGFYIYSLLFDFGYGRVAADPEIRKKYEELAEKYGKEYVYSLLKEADCETASKLHPNDLKRVIRALEIFDASGKKKSAQRDKMKPVYDYRAFVIDYPREELYGRINKRVDEMLRRGLVDEVTSLMAKGIDENCLSMQAIGYKEVLENLKNKNLSSTVSDIIKQNTRRYAKRQLTFFKKMPNLTWLKPAEATADKVLEIFND